MITIILEGGLGNRMRVAASAYAMMRQTGIRCRVLWLPQWGMHCRYDSLFLPYAGDDEGFELRDAHWQERLVYGRPTLRNLHLPRLLQWVRHRGRVMASPRVLELSRQDFDFASWCRQGDALMCSYRDFYEWSPDDLRRLLRPTPQMLQLADARTADFGGYTIGVHIRRTDHQSAIDESPLELFIEAVDKELVQHPDLKLFLATDDEATKAAMRERYAARVITSPAKATRDTTEGIQDALAEMLALSRTAKIYGSANSTFSQIAACWGGIPIDILTRHGLGESNLKVSM